jgi:hypothetical protein
MNIYARARARSGRLADFPLVLTHVAASSELSVVCELNRDEILRDVAERYAVAHAE